MRTRMPLMLALAATTAWTPATLAQQAGPTPPPAADDSVAIPVVTVQDSSLDTIGEGAAADGYRAVTATVGPLGRMALKDTPYSVNVTSGQLMENSNAHTVQDALKTNPTATLLMSSAGYSSMSRMMVRGFTAADQSEMRDGLVDRSFSYPPIENVDRIEVFNGFTGFLYGFSALGGSVNYVSKKPTPDPLASLSIGTYGGGLGYAQADLGGPVAGTDGKLGYRLNAYREDGSTYVDDSSQDRNLLSGRLEYKAAPDTTLWTDLWHQKYHAQGLQTYMNLGAGIRVPDASNFDAHTQYGQSWTYNKAEKTVGGLGFDTKMSDVLTLRAGYRYGVMWRQYNYVGATLTNNNGAYTEQYTNSPRQDERTHSEYALIDAHLKSWDITHDLTAGYTGTDFYYTRGSDVSRTLGTSNINSTVSFNDPNAALGEKNNFMRQYYDNYMLGDHITINDQWSALVGANYGVLKQTAWGTGVAISTSNYTKDKLTPTYALMYKPAPGISTYVSYMEGLVAGESSSAAGVANRYQVLAPSVSKQYETGVKTTFGGMDVNAALFRIDKVNSEVDPTDNVFKQDGREIHQGLELMATGKLTDRLTLVGGLTLMDAHISKAVANPATEDKTPINVPETQGRLYLEYALPYLDNLTLTGGANYYGKRPVNVMNTDYLDAATTFDAGLRYEPELYGHKTAVNLTVSNLFDTAYWAYYRSGDGLLLGAPRVVSLSLKTTW